MANGNEVVSEVLVSDSDVVNLNVGGTLYATKRGALRLISGSVLELMFSGGWENQAERDKYGNVFLDYDPFLFSILLRYLAALHTYGMAAQHLELRPIPVHLEEEFRLMLQHLGLKEIIQPHVDFKWSPIHKTPTVTLKKADTVAVSDGDGILRHHVLSHEVFHGGIFKFNVLVEYLEEWAMIGIVRSDVHLELADDACTEPGTYGWGSDGKVFVNGVESSKRAYPGRPFETGDQLSIILDCRYDTLTLLAPIADEMMEYKIPKVVGTHWRLVLATYFGSSAFEVTVK